MKFKNPTEIVVVFWGSPVEKPAWSAGADGTSSSITSFHMGPKENHRGKRVFKLSLRVTVPLCDCPLSFYSQFPNRNDDAVLGEKPNLDKKRKQEGRVELKQELTQRIGHKNWWCFHTLLENENKTRKESGDKSSTEFNRHKKAEAGTQNTLHGVLHISPTLRGIWEGMRGFNLHSPASCSWSQAGKWETPSEPRAWGEPEPSQGRGTGEAQGQEHLSHGTGTGHLFILNWQNCQKKLH